MDTGYVVQIMLFTRDAEDAAAHGHEIGSSLFVTEHEPDHAALLAYVNSRGVEARVEIKPAELLAGDGSFDLKAWIEATVIDETQSTRPVEKVALDELRRAQTMTENKLDRLTALVEKLVTSGATPAQSRAERPPASHPRTLRRDGRTRTPEMGSDDPAEAVGQKPNTGNMRLVGTPPRSDVFVVGADKNGKRTLVAAPLPKVGDTLKPNS